MSFFKKTITINNIYKLLFIKLLFSLLLLLVTQWLFLALNKNFFTVASVKDFFSILFGSIIYAVSATLFLQIPFILLNIIPLNIRYERWYQKMANFFFIVSTLVGLILNIIDIVYYRFTFRRMTADIFQYLGVGGDFKDLIPAFIKDYWSYFLIFIIICVIMYWLVARFVLEKKKSTSVNQYLKNTAIAIGIIIFCFAGMYTNKNILNAVQYTSAQNIPTVVNTPSSIIFTITKSGVQEEHFFTSDKELEKVYTPENNPYFITDTIPSTTNVVIFVLESFSAEYMGCMNGGKESFTPFLDSLAEHSLVFQGMANGKRSIEAIPAVLSGVPSFMNEAYITSQYSGNTINSMPNILKKYGYSSAFFHGAYNGSMGFDAFAQLAGFDKYYGKTEYNNDADADGTWGIFDEPFLQFMSAKLNDLKPPFLATVFTISSHHPYKLPEQHKNSFKKGKLPILEVVMYSDYALKRFFETASKQDWYDNTLFVITADHTAQPMEPFYGNSYGMYKVPMIFYKPNSTEKEFSNRIVQQSDVLPSIIDYLHLNEKCIAFGNSAFNPNSKPFHISFSNGYYQLIKDDYLIIFNEEIVEAYNLKTDPLLQNNLKNMHSNKVKNLEVYLKAIIQQYNNRLINDNLVVR